MHVLLRRSRSRALAAGAWLLLALALLRLPPCSTQFSSAASAASELSATKSAASLPTASPLLRSPNNTYSAICLVAKDENRYIEEWVQYHRCLGIGKVYLYDHDSRKPMSREVTRYVDEGYVEYIRFEGSHIRWGKDQFADNITKFSATIQGSAYRDCVERFSHRHKFMGFIDVDEFLVFHDPTIRHVDDLLKRYEGYGGVSFYWLMFGSGGHKLPPKGWVTRNYLRCLPRKRGQNTQFKTFVNTAYKPVMYSPHRAMFEVDEPTSILVDSKKQPIPPGRNKNNTHAVAAIYHYATKSKQEFHVKRMRGGGAGVTRPRFFIRRLDEACTETCYGAALLYARLCGSGT